MTAHSFDVIVVGARCAGSPTAMLLARKGYRVLVVDRATLSERHGLDPHRAPAGRRGARALGSARPAGRDRLPADPHLRLRLRPLHDRRRARHGRGAGRLLPAAHGPRQAARRRRGRGRRRGSRRLHRRRGPGRGRACAVGIKGRSRRGESDDRARQRRHRRRRPALDRRRGGPAGTVQREAAAARRLLRLLERAADGRPLRDLHPRPARLRGRPDARRPDAGHRRLAVRGVRGEQEGHRGQLPERRSSSSPSSPSACAKREAGGATSPARRCRTTSASPTVPAGRWSATPATTGTSSPAQGITDAFRDAELCAAALDEAFVGNAVVRRGDGRATSAAATRA